MRFKGLRHPLIAHAQKQTDLPHFTRLLGPHCAQRSFVKDDDFTHARHPSPSTLCLPLRYEGAQMNRSWLTQIERLSLYPLSLCFLVVMTLMLPFALPSDQARHDWSERRHAHDGARALRAMVKLYVSQGQRNEAQRHAFTRDMLAALPHADAMTLFDIATELCPCPDIDFTIAAALMERSHEAALTLHAEALFLHENYLLAMAKRGDVSLAAAIALRADLSHGLLLALLARDESLIDCALADNHGLLLPREIRRTLLLRGRYDSAIAEALLRRRDIQPLELLPLFLQGTAHARAKLIHECAPLLTPALRPQDADREMDLRIAAFQEAGRGRYGPLAEFFGLDANVVERFCLDMSGEPLALMCAAAELRGFDTLSVLAHWPTEPARHAGRLSALSDIATGLLPGIALALLYRAA